MSTSCEKGPHAAPAVQSSLYRDTDLQSDLTLTSCQASQRRNTFRPKEWKLGAHTRACCNVHLHWIIGELALGVIHRPASSGRVCRLARC